MSGKGTGVERVRTAASLPESAGSPREHPLPKAGEHSLPKAGEHPLLKTGEHSLPKVGRAEQTGPRPLGRAVGPRDARPGMHWREGGRADWVLRGKCAGLCSSSWGGGEKEEAGCGSPGLQEGGEVLPACGAGALRNPEHPLEL